LGQGRIVPNDIVLRGYKIPAKTFIMLSTSILGKDPKYFQDPDKFQPERWLEGKEKVS
jgi:cytochrome P450